MALSPPSAPRAATPNKGFRATLGACVGALAVLGAFAVSTAAASPFSKRGQGPIAHEYFEPDPEEDLKLLATTPDGSLPAALRTENGVVSAPSAYRDPLSAATAYGGSSVVGSADSSFRIDRNTTQPALVTYDEPFSPSIAPFKRTYAFDAVNAKLELVVSDPKLMRLEPGGSVRAGDDAFYGDLFVDLVANVPVRIPSVGPGARLLRVKAEPKAELEFYHDGADNWFVRGTESRRVRLLLQLAIAREAFGAKFADTTWANLERHLPALPPQVAAFATGQARELGWHQGLTPAQIVSQMVAYFRGFQASEEPLSASSGLTLYSELLLRRKGVCRHRAYAFVVTALALGIPSRMVHNEAHAWVEIYDGSLWQRVDLGGAAGQMAFTEERSLGTHEPPPDPYLWPQGSTSGERMVEASRNQSQALAQGSPALPPDTQPTSPVASSTPAEDPAVAARARAELVLASPLPSSVFRGAPLTLEGHLRAESGACGNARVDILLQQPSEVVFVGSLATNEEGAFSGEVVVPRSLLLGDWQLLLRSHATSRCAATESSPVPGNAR